MLTVGLESQQRISGPDGAILYVGGTVVANDFMAKNVSAGIYSDVFANAPAALIPLGHACLWARGATAALSSFIPRQQSILPTGGTQGWMSTDPGDFPHILRICCTNMAADRIDNVGFMGVATEPIGYGKSGVVAAHGSLITVRCSATAIAVGAFVGGQDGTTALQPGSGTATGPLVTVTTTPGRILGVCITPNTGTPTAPAGGTGSTGHVGIVVQPA